MSIRLTKVIHFRNCATVVLFAVLLLMSASGAKSQIVWNVNTVLGPEVNGIPCNNGSGGSYTLGIAVDASGNIYESDYYGGVICKKTPSGTVSLFAGTGPVPPSGCSGPAVNGVPANQLNLCNPMGLAVDSSGNLYVAQNGNCFILKIDAVTSVATTVVGNGTCANIPPANPTGWPTSTPISNGTDVKFDSHGNLFISTTNQVYEVNLPAASPAITLLAGDGNNGYTPRPGLALSTEFASIGGIAVDSSDNVFIVDSPDNEVDKLSNGTINTYVAGYYQNDLTIAVDGQDDLFVGYWGWLYEVMPTGYPLTVVPIAGNGTSNYMGDGVLALSAEVTLPGVIALDSIGNIYFDDLGGRVRELTPANCNVSGYICTIAGNGNPTFFGDGGPANLASLNNPLGLYVDGSNNIFVADAYNNRVREFTVGGNISTVAGNGTGGYQFFDSGDGGLAVNATTNTPGAISEDGLGNLDILDEFANGNAFPNPNADTISNLRIVSLSTGQISTLPDYACTIQCSDSTFSTFTNDLVSGTHTDPTSGNVETGFYYIFYGDSSVSFITGTPTVVCCGVSVNAPTALAADTNGNVYVSSAPSPIFNVSGNMPLYNIQMIDQYGNISLIAGVPGCSTYDSTQDGGSATSACMTPGALAVDTYGDVFLVDLSANVIRVVVGANSPYTSEIGHIYTIVGTPSTGSFSGDGGPALSATLNAPGGIKLDASGNLYISDTLNNRVRMVTGAVSLIPHGIGNLPGSGCTPSLHHPCPGGE